MIKYGLNFDIPFEILNMLDLLRKAGYESFIVGGAVRDALIGRKINDYDIATSAVPEEIKAVFSGYKIYDIGIKHGTVIVIDGKYEAQITTYRCDGEYTDNRHPSSVTFASKIEDDLSRRDFTINAMAYYDGIFIDPFFGINDISNKIIRCVGKPDKRFSEDSLRIIRALRFSSQLNYRIEKNTSKSIIKLYKLLDNISAERIQEELKKLLEGIGAEKILCEYAEIFSHIIPGIKIENAGKIKELKKDYITRLGILIGDNAELVLKKLRFDNKSIADIIFLVKYRDISISHDAVQIKRLLRIFGYDNLARLSDIKGDGLLLNSADEIIKKNECYKISQLDIKGDDIIACGVTKGENVGKILNLILEEVVEEKLENKKDTLILRVKKLIEEKGIH